MLNHPTLDKLEALRFTGMAKALTKQMAVPDIIRRQLTWPVRIDSLKSTLPGGRCLI